MVMLKSLPGARGMGLVVVGLYSLTTLFAAVEGCLVSVLVMKPLLGDMSGHEMAAVSANLVQDVEAGDTLLKITKPTGGVLKVGDMVEIMGDDENPDKGKIGQIGHDGEAIALNAVLFNDHAAGAKVSKKEEPPQLTTFSALDSILNIFDGLVPKNLAKDAADGYLLPLIVASIIFGLLVKDKNEDGSESATLVVVGEMNDVVVKVVTFLMNLTPIGVGSLVFAAMNRLDLATTGRIVGMFMVSVIIGLSCHMLVVYPMLTTFLSRQNPLMYVYNIVPALLTALGTSSSAAALPVTTRCCIEKNNVAPHIAKFVLSLGATINMDGTGMYLICAAFFLGTIEGVTFTFSKFATMAVLAMLCSLGTAPVPSASLVLLATIMSSVGIPLTASFGLITAVDWLLDRLRTVVNVSGDASVTAVIDRFFGDGNGMKAINGDGADSETDSDEAA